MEPTKKIKKLNMFSGIKNPDFLSSDFILEIPFGFNNYVCEVNSDIPNLVRMNPIGYHLDYGYPIQTFEPIRIEVNRVRGFDYTDFYREFMEWLNNNRKINVTLNRTLGDGTIISKWLLVGCYITSYSLTPIDDTYSRIGFTLHFDHVIYTFNDV